MKKVLYFTALLFTVGVAIPACDKDDDDNNGNTNTLSEVDKNFMTQASFSNRNEIDFAQLALTQSTNDSVKAFAQTIIADHTEALAKLDSIGNRYNFQLPNTIDSAHAAMKPQMQALTGLAFDTTYANSQVQDHLTAISLFQNEVNNGSDPTVKNYASTTLPHLQMHLEEANNLKAYLQ